MNLLSVFVRFLPIFCLCLGMVGCGDTPKTAVVEQPQMSAEEQAAAEAEYNKSMDN